MMAELFPQNDDKECQEISGGNTDQLCHDQDSFDPLMRSKPLLMILNNPMTTGNTGGGTSERHAVRTIWPKMITEMRGADFFRLKICNDFNLMRFNLFELLKTVMVKKFPCGIFFSVRTDFVFRVWRPFRRRTLGRWLFAPTFFRLVLELFCSTGLRSRTFSCWLHWVRQRAPRGCRSPQSKNQSETRLDEIRHVTSERTQLRLPSRRKWSQKCVVQIFFELR